jgi:hypothetical protein
MREAIMRAQCYGLDITSSQEVDEYIAQRVGNPEKEHEVLRRSVNMEWGNEKELFAIEAMRRQLLKRPELKDFFEGTILLETGFTPCHPHDCCGDMIRVGDEVCDVMCFVGASPDAIVAKPREEGVGDCVAVFEAKCKSPFYITAPGSAGTSPMRNCVLFALFVCTAFLHASRVAGGRCVISDETQH